MNLYYAMGGGLGHLTRARAFLENQVSKNESLIFTSSPFAGDKRAVGNFSVVKADKSFEKDRAAFQKFINNIFTEFKIKKLFIDSFPFGIINEFIDFRFPENLEIYYVARHLKWEKYAPFEKNIFPKFHQTFILEFLETEHQEFVDQVSERQIKIELKYPPAILTADDEKILHEVLHKSPFWLIVHSGSVEEILELINFADEMREIEGKAINLVLISPEPVSIQKPNFYHYNFYPASVLFEQAERIFTACGFNAMMQTKNFRNKHYFIPFERRYDDQFARAARVRNTLKIV